MESKVTIDFVGTGNAFCTDGRANQCIMISWESWTVLIDAGPTSLCRLEQMKVNLNNIDAIFFTHFHGDHIGGYPSLVLAMKMVYNRINPLLIIGPNGIENKLNTLYETFFGLELGFRVDYKEFEPVISKGNTIGKGLEIDIIPMEHKPESIGYAIHIGGKKIAITGDTKLIDPVYILSSDSDVFMPECSVINKDESPHISQEQIIENIEKFNSKLIIPIHTSDSIARLFENYNDSRIRIAYDGDRILV